MLITMISWGSLLFVLQGYFVGPFEPGKPLTGGGLAAVKASKSADFAEGDVISGMVPWSSYFVLDVEQQVSLRSATSYIHTKR